MDETVVPGADDDPLDDFEGTRSRPDMLFKVVLQAARFAPPRFGRQRMDFPFFRIRKRIIENVYRLAPEVAARIAFVLPTFQSLGKVR